MFLTILLTQAMHHSHIHILAGSGNPSVRICSPLFAEFTRRCVLSGGGQRRALDEGKNYVNTISGAKKIDIIFLLISNNNLYF